LQASKKAGLAAVVGGLHHGRRALRKGG